MQQFDLKDKSFLDYSKSKIVNNAINELSEEKKATVYNVVKLYENENNLLNLVKNLLQLDLTNDILNCTILIIFSVSNYRFIMQLSRCIHLQN